MASVKHIVFVDHDARLLEELRHALRRHRHEWDMEFVSESTQALQLMEARGVDVVVAGRPFPKAEAALADESVTPAPAAAAMLARGPAFR